MTFRDQPAKAVQESALITKSMEELSEFPITEWLFRLNLVKYLPKFTKREILFVSDLKKWI
jgi:hypothetical protein